MRLGLILGGIFIIVFICIVPLKRDIDEYNVQKTGQEVEAIITDVPNCIGTKVSHFLKFKFENKIYSKRVGAPCDQFKPGQVIRLKHKAGTDIFLYMNEKKESEFAATGAMAAIGILFIGYSLNQFGIESGRFVQPLFHPHKGF